MSSNPTSSRRCQPCLLQKILAELTLEDWTENNWSNSDWSVVPCDPSCSRACFATRLTRPESRGDRRPSSSLSLVRDLDSLLHNATTFIECCKKNIDTVDLVEFPAAVQVGQCKGAYLPSPPCLKIPKVVNVDFLFFPRILILDAFWL